MWQECPAVTRIGIVCYPVLSILLMLIESAYPAFVAYGFMCTWLTTVDHFCLWSLFTSLVYRPFSGGMSFLMTLFEIYMAMMYFPAREKDMGSTTFLVWALVVNALVNIVFLLIMFVLSLGLLPSAVAEQNQGFWPLCMVCLTLNMLSNPDSSTSFWGILSIPNKWYPIALTGIFSLMRFSIAWPFVAACVVGYGWPYIPIERLLPSKTRVSNLEQRCFSGGPPRQYLGTPWIRASDTAGFDLESGARSFATVSDLGRTGSQSLARPQESSSSGGGEGGGHSFVAFGGSGCRLGDSVTPSASSGPHAANAPCVSRAPELESPAAVAAARRLAHQAQTQHPTAPAVEAMEIDESAVSRAALVR